MKLDIQLKLDVQTHDFPSLKNVFFSNSKSLSSMHFECIAYALSSSRLKITLKR